MGLLTPYWMIDMIIVFTSILVMVYFYMTRNFNYWKKRGVFEIPPIPILGNFGDCCFFRKSIADYLKHLYDQSKGLPYMGFYLFDKPVLVLRDPEIIKNVLSKDFDYFANRYARTSESDVMGNHNLFLLKNPDWRNLRQKLTPVFSSGKIKGMFSLINAVGDDLLVHCESLQRDDDCPMIELKDTFAKYTTDVIGTCVFGLQVNCLNNPDAEFRKHGKAIFEVSYARGIELMSVFFAPGLVKPLGFTVFNPNTQKFLRTVFWDTFDKRVKSGLRRNDLVDLLMDLKNSHTDSGNAGAFKFDGDSLVAQAALFFSAGFETSASTLSFTLHELSVNPDIQTKLREEIDSAIKKNDGAFSYEMLQQLPYIDMVLAETLRKYPALPFLDREAIRDYTVEKTGLVIEKGTPIYIPMLGLQYDPQYYPNPTKYGPERFNKENKRTIPSCAYLPFGEGPHNCIGSRFGLMLVKIGLIRLLSNYEIIPCEKTVDPVCIDPKALIITSESGLYHRIRKVQRN